MEEVLRETGILPRGLAHPVIFEVRPPLSPGRGRPCARVSCALGKVQPACVWSGAWQTLQNSSAQLQLRLWPHVLAATARTRSHARTMLFLPCCARHAVPQLQNVHWQDLWRHAGRRRPWSGQLPADVRSGEGALRRNQIKACPVPPAACGGAFGRPPGAAAAPWAARGALCRQRIAVRRAVPCAARIACARLSRTCARPPSPDTCKLGLRGAAVAPGVAGHRMRQQTRCWPCQSSRACCFEFRISRVA